MGGEAGFAQNIIALRNQGCDVIVDDIGYVSSPVFQDGIIAQVDLPGEPPRYESAGKAAHHHFQCKSCNRVYDVPGQLQSAQELAPEGFLISGHLLMLYGQCSTCAMQGNIANVAAHA